MNKKPKSIKEYKKWLREEHATDVGKQTRMHYETVADKVMKDFRESDFWMEFTEQFKLRDLDEQYKRTHDNYPLVMGHVAPKLEGKRFESFLLKTYRRNVLENDSWPEPPQRSGQEPQWILPDNWFG